MNNYYSYQIFNLFIGIMKNLTCNELRTLWNKFRESKQHKYIPEASLIASSKESTALFNVAGMQQLIPYLMGKEHPLWKRVFNIQKCVRTVDIAEVWDASHLTFFEMMGNWSLWDYFKNEAVSRSREFLTSPEYLNIDPKKLAVTVFAWDESAPRDDTTANKRKEMGLPENRISYLPADNNRWSPGPVWPCWPDTEIFYRVWESEFPTEWSNVWNDEDNWMEIWNNVFMEFYRDESGTLTKLTNHNVDTWMGLERMCCVLQQKESVYDTDVFLPAISKLEEITWITYVQQSRRFRIIVDHARTAFMLINDWLIPSNLAAGYVLRMIIRRMTYNIMLLHDFDISWYQNICKELLESFKHLREFKTEEILRVLLEEIQTFLKTIQNGKAILDEIIQKEKANQSQFLSGKDAFKLYDTYGFPYELTKEIVEENGLKINEKEYEEAVTAAKENSRQATKEMFKKWIDWSKYLEWIPQTQFIWYKEFETSNVQLLKDFEVNWQRVLIFDKTPFYAEMWWQMWDKWTIELDDWTRLKVTNVQTFAWVTLHIVE